jgi:rhodanese-related sulfurtransferase
MRLWKSAGTEPPLGFSLHIVSAAFGSAACVRLRSEGTNFQKSLITNTFKKGGVGGAHRLVRKTRGKRVAPNGVLERPSLIPKEQDAVVYCTCPSDTTSRTVLRRALALQFFRVKFLKGGLAAWKAKGYPVEPYQEVFYLYTPSLYTPSLAPGSR